MVLLDVHHCNLIKQSLISRSSSWFMLFTAISEALFKCTWPYAWTINALTRSGYTSGYPAIPDIDLA